MSKVPPQEFQKRFKLLREVLDQTTFYRKEYYRDLLHRRNVVVYKYAFLSEEECLESLEKAVDLYEKGLSVDLLGYTVEQDHLDRNFSLSLIYNHYMTLDEFIYDHGNDKLRILSLREIVYICLRVAKMLAHLESINSYHGNIDENNLYVDQDFVLKMCIIPLKDVNVARLIKYRSYVDLPSCPSLISPEFMRIYNGTGNIDTELSPRVILKSDIFSLGLMCIRLLSPRALIQGYNLTRMEIDFNRIYILIDTLGTFVDSSFASTIKQCLSYDFSFRPEPFFLVEEILATHLILPENLNGVAKREFQKDQGLGSTSRSEKTSTSGKKTPNEPNYSIETSESELTTPKKAPLLHRKPLIRTIETLHEQEGEKRNNPVFSGIDSDRLGRLRSECLHFIENKVFDNLPHKSRKELTNEGNKYLIKTMRDGVDVGFILHQNRDVYFGYITGHKSNDIGILFLANKEVYFGEFRDGRIAGKGCLLMTNKMMFDGDWLDNQLHGNVVVRDSNTNDTYWCIFDHGNLIAKDPVDSSTLGSDHLTYMTLEDFYYKTFKAIDPIREIYDDYLAHLGDADFVAKEVSSKYSRRPAGRSHKYKQRYEDYLDKSPVATKEDDSKYNQSVRESDRKSPRNTPKKSPNKNGYLNSNRERSKSPSNISRTSKSRTTRSPAPSQSNQKPSTGRVMPRFINSNKKEKAYENQGKDRYRTSAHKDVYEMLNNPNREFTFPKYYNDVLDIEPREEHSILANLDPIITSRKMSPARQYSPTRRILEEGWRDPSVSSIGKHRSNKKKTPTKRLVPPLKKSPVKTIDKPVDKPIEVEDDSAPDIEKPNTFIDFNRYPDLSNSGKPPQDLPATSPRDRRNPRDIIGTREPGSAGMKYSLTDAKLPIQPHQESFHLPSQDESFFDIPSPIRPEKTTPGTKPKTSPTKISAKKNQKEKSPNKNTADKTSRLKSKPRAIASSRSESKDPQEIRKGTKSPQATKTKPKPRNKENTDIVKLKQSESSEKLPSTVGYQNLNTIQLDMVKSRPAEDYSGYGWIHYTNGEKFYGYFSEGIPNGIGTFYTFKNKLRNGRWNKGVYV